MKTLSRQDELKREAALAALDELIDDTVVGVGTGSTVNFFIDGLAQRRQRFAGAVSSSRQSTQRLVAAGLRVLTLNEVIQHKLSIPVYVDGADEINPALQMIKGGGGALTQEKILASASGRFVCVVDASKQVPVLGHYPLPVEVIASAREILIERFAAVGGQARERSGFVTDNGHPILDVSGLVISDPIAFEQQINGWPGVVTVGLFACRPADLALVATAAGVRRVVPDASVL